MNNKDLIRQYVDTGGQIPEYQMKRLPNNLLRTYIRKRIIRASRTQEHIEGYELNGFTPEEFNQHISQKNDFKLYDDDLRNLSDNLRKIYLSARVKNTKPGYRDTLDDYEFNYAMLYPDILKEYIDHVKKLPEEQFNQLDNDFLPYYYKQRFSYLTGDYSDISGYELNRMDNNMKHKIIQTRFNLAMNDETEEELNDYEIMELDEKQKKEYIIHVLTKNNVDIDYKDRQNIYPHFSDDVNETLLDWIISRGQQLEDDEIKNLNPKLKVKYIKTQLKKGNDLPNYLKNWYNKMQNHE